MQDSERAILEQKYSHLPVLERTIAYNGGQLEDPENSNGTRLYARRPTPTSGTNTGFLAIVHDGEIENSSITAIAKVAGKYPGILQGFYVDDSKKGPIKGFIIFGEDDFRQSLSKRELGSQISLEVSGHGELEIKTINAIKRILTEASKTE